jgi:hypothetical protein
VNTGQVRVSFAAARSLPRDQACKTENTPHSIVTSPGWFHRTLNNPPVTSLWKDGEVQGFTSWIGFKSWIDTGSPSTVGAFVITNQALPMGPTNSVFQS